MPERAANCVIMPCIISIISLEEITCSAAPKAPAGSKCSFNALCYPCLVGDLDHDGNVAVNDIVIILDFLLGDNSLSGYQNCSSNLNNDENVDVMDIVRVVNIILEN